jgi:ankyrin repeat protein
MRNRLKNSALMLAGCVATLGVVGYLGVRGTFSHNTRSPSPWRTYAQLGFPFSVAKNLVYDYSGEERRTLILFLDARYFSADKLKESFLSLSTEYPQPLHLDITAVSDQEVVKALIDQNYRPMYSSAAIGAKSNDQEEHAPTPYLVLRPHLLARYIRRIDEERFDYNTKPGEEVFESVIIRAKLPQYTGDPGNDLLVAAEFGDKAKVISIVTRGINVDSKDQYGETALMKAVVNRRREVTMFLLAKGADPNSRDDEGGTAIIDAASSSPAMVRLLLDAGADVNAQDIRGETALLLAAYWGNDESVRILIESGANIECRDVKGNTPIMNAAMNGQAEITRMLLRRGANPHVINTEGESALALARKGQNGVVIQLLEQAKADK